MKTALLLCGLVACWTGDVPPPAQPRPPVAEPAEPVAAPPAARESPLSPESVNAKIATDYMPDIRRCYKELLKVQADAKGKVKLSFTIDEAGRIVNGKALAFSTQIEQCVTGLMPSWQFPIPKDGSGSASREDFELTLSLVPD